MGNVRPLYTGGSMATFIYISQFVFTETSCFKSSVKTGRVFFFFFSYSPSLILKYRESVNISMSISSFSFPHLPKILVMVIAETSSNWSRHLIHWWSKECSPTTLILKKTLWCALWATLAKYQVTISVWSVVVWWCTTSYRYCPFNIFCPYHLEHRDSNSSLN